MYRRLNVRLAMAAALLALMTEAASAAPLTFLGQDTGLGEGTRLPSHPNADAARASFLSSLVGVGTEDLESFANGTGAPLLVDFGAAGTATLNGSGEISNVPAGTNGVGRYPISGNQYWEGTNAFSITFSAPQAAFGFYGIDIGDFSGQVTLTLTNGGVEVVNIGNATNVPGGGVLYYGIIVDAGSEFTSVAFGNTASGTDFFGFDDFTIGTREQVIEPVPEPSTMALWLTGSVLGVAARVRYGRKSAARVS